MSSGDVAFPTMDDTLGEEFINPFQRECFAHYYDIFKQNFIPILKSKMRNWSELQRKFHILKRLSDKLILI